MIARVVVAGTIIAIVLAPASHAKGGKHEYIYAPILIPGELRFWTERKAPWVCRTELTIAGIMVRAVFAQSHKLRNPVLTKAYPAAVIAVKNYRECVKRTWPTWPPDLVPVPRNVG